MKLSPRKADDGYLRLKLFRSDGIQKQPYVHTLVCAAFYGPPKRGQQTRHLDGTRTNNAPANLKWGSVKDNIEDAKRHGTWVSGENNGNHKLTVADVLEIRSHKMCYGESTRLAKRYGVSINTIYRVRVGGTWKKELTT